MNISQTEFQNEYQEYLKVHSDIIDKAKSKGIIFPVYSEHASRWEMEDGGLFDPEAAYSWSRNVPRDLALSEQLIGPEFSGSLRRCAEKLASMQNDEEALMDYFSEMQNASEVIPGFLFHASRDGAIHFDSELKRNTLRICLEDIDGLEGLEGSKFLKTLRVPLDDGSPLAVAPSMSFEQFCAFSSALQESIRRHASALRLVHCSQGQSRSGLFVLCFLMTALPLSPSPDRHLSQCIDFLSSKRKILDFASRWYPFQVYYSQYLFRLKSLK